MPTIRLTMATIHLIRRQMPPGFRFVCLATETDDDSWDVPVNDEVAFRIAPERLPAEGDDHVVSRLVQAAIWRPLDSRAGYSGVRGDWPHVQLESISRARGEVRF